MKHINFPESNIPLRAGDNENTVPMRVMMCEHAGYKKGTEFIAGKFEFEPEEIAFIRAKAEENLKSYYAGKQPGLSPESIEIDRGALDAMLAALPPLWITSMHGWCPLILSVAHPFEMGYTKKILERPQDN